MDMALILCSQKGKKRKKKKGKRKKEAASLFFLLFVSVIGFEVFDLSEPVVPLPHSVFFSFFFKGSFLDGSRSR